MPDIPIIHTVRIQLLFILFIFLFWEILFTPSLTTKYKSEHLQDGEPSFYTTGPELFLLSLIGFFVKQSKITGNKF